jgi:chromosome segregation ATPase
MPSFRDRFLTPQVARAITSPSAILVTAAGASAAILLSLNPIGVVLVGAGALAARVLASVPRNPQRPRISPGSLVEPWSSLMAGILDGRKRFGTATRDMQTGPLNDRLMELGERLQAGVDEAWRIAVAGNQLSTARRQIDSNSISAELQQAQTATRTQRSDQTIQALQAQLSAAQRLDLTINDTYDQLRLLDARLDEMVTRTIELSVSQATPSQLGSLGTEVDSIVNDMEALRQAVEETQGNSPQGDSPEEPQLGTGAGSA